MELGLFVWYPSREGVSQAQIAFGCNAPLEHQIKAVRLINKNVVPRFK